MVSRYTFDYILARSILYKYDLQVYIRSDSGQIYPIQVWSPHCVYLHHKLYSLQTLLSGYQSEIIIILV